MGARLAKRGSQARSLRATIWGWNVHGRNPPRGIIDKCSVGGDKRDPQRFHSAFEQWGTASDGRSARAVRAYAPYMYLIRYEISTG